MSLYPKVKALLTASVLGGAALLMAVPAQASDFDDDFGLSYHRPRVERKVTTVTTVTRTYSYDRPVYGRPVYDEDDYAPRRRSIERRRYAQPIFYGRPVYGRPVWDDQDDCRLIVKRKVNPWGDVEVTRVRRCD